MRRGIPSPAFIGTGILIASAFILSACITPQQVAKMSDHQVCQGAVAWPAGGAPVLAQGGYGDMYTFEANGRGLSISRCADRLLTSLLNVSDQNVCARSVIWSEREQVPYWSRNGGIYRHVAQSRGFEPLDCHDSNFECLDHGFNRGSDGFRRCRVQLIAGRRENARIRLAIEAAAEAEAYQHQIFHHQVIQRRRRSRHHGGHGGDAHDRGNQPSPQHQVSQDRVPQGRVVKAPPPGAGPVSKIVADFRAGKSVRTAKTRNSRPTPGPSRPPARLQAAVEALLEARKSE